MLVNFGEFSLETSKISEFWDINDGMEFKLIVIPLYTHALKCVLICKNDIVDTLLQMPISFDIYIRNCENGTQQYMYLVPGLQSTHNELIINI